MDANLQIELAPRQKNGLLLKNPVLTASGTFGFGVEYAKLGEVPRLGGVISKGITLHARSPQAAKRVVETAAGLLYTLDGPNPGLQVVRKKYAPVWANWQTPVIVNIMGNELDELADLAQRLEEIEGIAGIELSALSADARTSWEDEPSLLAEIVTAVRYATTLPLIVKLSPGKHDLLVSARTAIEAGANAISLIQTLPALGVDTVTRRPHFSPPRSGFSGPALKPLALRYVYELAHELRNTQPTIPIIGVGGIASTNDALEFLLAGASAIQVGSVTFANPRAAVEIVEGLEAFMQREGVADIHDLIGAAF
ncbi:MAG TPA: dihydroorotate dehydrogenase [Ktedonobacteraceae bacterium]|nr:dihydroorotate dehydrogenase [Ktedonobacteraceae bacterium]